MRIMHIFEVLQWCGDVLHLRPTAPQIAEPHGEQWWQHHYGQCLYIRCGE